MIKILHRVDSEGKSNKEILSEMARQFRSSEYRDFATDCMCISGALAEQLAQFFEDMANAIE